MHQTAEIDNPWRRLPWTLTAAMLIWAVALLGFAYFMEKSSYQPAELPPIEAQLIEQPVPAAKHERPAAAQKPKPLPTVKQHQAPVAHQVSPPAAQKEIVTTNTPVALPSAAAPKGSQTTATGNISANSGGRAGAFDGKSSTRGNIYASSGARAIIQPKPQIPDDLREGAFNFSPLVRFHIAVDGGATVELVKPTPNPRLNRILLDSLRKWRFIPAIKNGKPVASTEDIIINLEVK